MNAKVRNIVTLFLSAVAMGVAVSPSMAGVTCSVNGGTMTVRATSSLAGKRLFLLWDDTDKGDSVSGWWSHVSFDDGEGNRILDYVPVQRVADGKVGFYDRVASTFVASSGAGDFTAGAVADETPTAAVNSCSAALTVKTIAGLVI